MEKEKLLINHSVCLLECELVDRKLTRSSCLLTCPELALYVLSSLWVVDCKEPMSGKERKHGARIQTRVEDLRS